ncbi:hypothetical protein [Sinomicrobium sp. M5D2P17]
MSYKNIFIAHRLLRYPYFNPNALLTKVIPPLTFLPISVGKLCVARNKLLAENLDDEDYLKTKKECKAQIEKLEEQLSKRGLETQDTNINELLDKALKGAGNIAKLYGEGGIRTRRGIISSIFPEKLEFDGTNYRTIRMNVITHRIFHINNKLPQNKNKKSDHFNRFSCHLMLAKQIPNHFVEDLKQLAGLHPEVEVLTRLNFLYLSEKSRYYFLLIVYSIQSDNYTRTNFINGSKAYIAALLPEASSLRIK